MKHFREGWERTGVLLRGDVECCLHPTRQRRAESRWTWETSPRGSAHLAQFGPEGTGDSSPPTPHTAVKREGVRARL